MRVDERVRSIPRWRLATVATVVWLAGLACGPPPAPPPPKKPQKVLGMLDRLATDFEGVPSRWSRRSSANFTVLYLKYGGIAQLVLDTAEETRASQLRAWGRRPTRWSPRCRIYFYPSTDVMRRMTVGTTRHGSAQAPASRLVKGQLRYRRINIAAGDRGILEDTLPHELSHLILSELMAPKEPPLWANEGLAMQAESRELQLRRARALARQLTSGTRPFPLATLLALKRYPDQEHLFYGQSHVLMRVLLRRGGKRKLLAFLQDSADLPALEQHYRLTESRLNSLWRKELRKLARR